MKRQFIIKFSAAVLLILTALILFYIYLSKNETELTAGTETEAKPFVKNRISRQIDSVIFTFGIKKEWILDSAAAGKGKKKEKLNTQLIYKEVLVPPDLPMTDLNYEISGFLNANNLTETVTEDAKGKNLTMNFYRAVDTARELAGIMKFSYADSVKRNAAEVCLVLDSIEYYNLADMEKIFRSTQEFSVFLPLENDKADFQSAVTDAKRDFLIKLFLGNEDDVDADLKTGMKEAVWKSKIRALYLNFPQAGGIILYSGRGLDEFESGISEEFQRNNMKVFKDTMFIKVKKGENKTTSLFKDIVYRSNSGKKLLFYIVNFSPEEFNEYDSRVYTLKKLGYRFFSFKQLTGRLNDRTADQETK